MNNVENFQTLFNKFTFRGAIGVIVVILAIGFVYALLIVRIPPQNENIINIAAGSLLALAGQVIGWYFGSSKDKADADKVEHAKSLSSKETSTTTSVTPTP